MTCDLKKGKYVYWVCYDPKNPSKRIFVPESKIMAQIEPIFKSLQIPSAVLSEMVGYLQETHESEKIYHNNSIIRLHRESEELTEQQDALVDILLRDASKKGAGHYQSITREMYDRKFEKLTQRQYEINKELEDHHEGNSQFKIALSMLVTLASKAFDLFRSSTVDEKRQLIGYVLSNLEMEGSNLRFSLRKPFDLRDSH